MKIIHCADIHLGSKLDSKFDKETSEKRKVEVLATFKRMIAYAKQEEVKMVLLSGDVFDSDRPAKKDKDFFYDAIKGNPEIEFFYLKGNHDSQTSYELKDIENLKTFGETWQIYSYGDIDIAGIEMSESNASSLYSTLNLNKNQINIVMLHGQIASSVSKDSIVTSKLKDKHIDYLALGHIHSYSSQRLDERGEYCYSGCLEGRGFDEMGEKGFVLLNVTDKIEKSFIPFALRTLHEVTVDISSANSLFEANRIVEKNIEVDKKDIVRIKLVGNIEFDNTTLEKDIKTFLAPNYFFVDVKNATKRKYDISDYEGDISLKGEFVRVVLNNSNIDESVQSQIIALGIKALNGEEV